MSNDLESGYDVGGSKVKARMKILHVNESLDPRFTREVAPVLGPFSFRQAH